jgi:hypothetical protein
MENNQKQNLIASFIEADAELKLGLSKRILESLTITLFLTSPPPVLSNENAIFSRGTA